MARVKALFSMEHNGSKKKGDVFEVSDKMADDLLRRGLVSRLKDVAPGDGRPDKLVVEKLAKQTSAKTKSGNK